MPTPIKGKEFTVKYNGLTVGYATSFDLQINKSTLDVTTLSTNGWNDFIVGNKEWSVSFDGLVTRTVGDASIGYSYLMEQFIASDASCVIAIIPDISLNKYLTGVGYFESLSMSGSQDSTVTFSGSFKGTGALTSATTA